MSEPFNVQCCFCGKTVVENKALMLTIALEGGGAQVVYCHSKCLGERLHPSVPRGF